MSVLSLQADKLRKHAERLRQLANGAVNQGFPARQDLYESAAEMREAADTIEGLRNRLQELQGVGGESRYTELFGTPERAVRTLAVGDRHADCGECAIYEACYSSDMGCLVEEPDALLEWLKGEGE